MSGNAVNFPFNTPPARTPQAGINTVISQAGTAVIVIPKGATGGYIINPYFATDQGLAVSEPLYVNQMTSPSLQGYGTTIALGLGQSFTLTLANSTSPVMANATSAGHRFTAVWWF